MNARAVRWLSPSYGFPSDPCAACGEMIPERVTYVTTWTPGEPRSRVWFHAECYDDSPEPTCSWCGGPAGECEGDGACLI